MHAIKKLLLMVFGCLWLTNSALAQDTAKASDTAANTSHRYKVIGNILSMFLANIHRGISQIGQYRNAIRFLPLI